MRKLLNNPYVVAALVVLAGAFVWSSLRSAKPDGQVAMQPAEAANPLPSPEEALPGPAQTSDALKALVIPKTTRDPFSSRAAAETPPPADTPDLPDSVDTAHLSGIWTQNGATLLVVNNRISQVGENIGRLTIESVEAQGIWLSHWNGRTFLAVGKTFTLKTPARLRIPVAKP